MREPPLSGPAVGSSAALCVCLCVCVCACVCVCVCVCVCACALHASPRYVSVLAESNTNSVENLITLYNGVGVIGKKIPWYFVKAADVIKPLIET